MTTVSMREAAETMDFYRNNAEMMDSAFRNLNTREFFNEIRRFVELLRKERISYFINEESMEHLLTDYRYCPTELLLADLKAVAQEKLDFPGKNLFVCDGSLYDLDSLGNILTSIEGTDGFISADVPFVEEYIIPNIKDYNHELCRTSDENYTKINRAVRKLIDAFSSVNRWYKEDDVELLSLQDFVENAFANY